MIHAGSDLGGEVWQLAYRSVSGLRGSDPGDVPGGFGGDARITRTAHTVQDDDAPSIGAHSVGMRQEERSCCCLTLS